jgi:hypothetical protein
MDWILSHDTLEEPALNDCQIAHYMSFPKALDSEGYKTRVLDTDDIPVYVNKLRWLHVIQRIEICLPRLMVFWFACGSAVNFEDGLILEIGLYLDRYMEFTRPWIDWAYRDAIKDPQCVWPQNDWKIEIEEVQGYRHLIAVVKARREQWLMSRHLLGGVKEAVSHPTLPMNHGQPKKFKRDNFISMNLAYTSHTQNCAA